MTFGEAIKSLKNGSRVARSGWNGKDMFLYFVRDWDAANNPLHAYTRLPFIAMKTADNGLVPWLASQTDMLALDWEIVP